jgi:hypothetical protein
MRLQPVQLQGQLWSLWESDKRQPQSPGSQAQAGTVIRGCIASKLGMNGVLTFFFLYRMNSVKLLKEMSERLTPNEPS